MNLTCDKRHWRTNEALTAKCPVCGAHNTECVPIKARWQMSFTCCNCGAWFAVQLEYLRRANKGKDDKAWELPFRFVYHHEETGNIVTQIFTLGAIERGMPRDWLHCNPGYICIGRNRFTGVKDNADREIYECDVVNGHYHDKKGRRRIIGEVQHLCGAFKVVGVNQCYGLIKELNSNFELIGNIYENLELVEDCDREEGDADSE